MEDKINIKDKNESGVSSDIKDVFTEKVKSLGVSQKFVMESLMAGFSESGMNKLEMKKCNSLRRSTEKSLNDYRDELITPDFVPFPKNYVSAIVAPGATGKTAFALQVAVWHVLTEHYERNRKSKVFLWFSEDSEDTTANRFKDITESVLGLREADIKRVDNAITLYDNRTKPFPIIETDFKKGTTVNPLLAELKKVCADYDLIISDPLIAFLGGSASENDNAFAKVFMQQITDWASKERKTIIMLHHSAKGTNGSRGASAFIDAFRYIVSIEKYIQPKMISIPVAGGVEKRIQETDMFGKKLFENVPDMKSFRKITIIKDNNNVEDFCRANFRDNGNSYEFNTLLFPIQPVENKPYFKPDRRFVPENDVEFSSAEEQMIRVFTQEDEFYEDEEEDRAIADGMISLLMEGGTTIDESDDKEKEARLVNLYNQYTQMKNESEDIALAVAID